MSKSFFIFVFILSLASTRSYAGKHIQTLFGPGPESYPYSERTDSQGNVTEFYRDLMIQREPKTGLPADFATWSKRETFLDHRREIMKSAAAVLQGTRFLPLATYMFVLKKLSKKGSIIREITDDAKSKNDTPSLEALGFNLNMRESILRSLNEGLWAARDNVASATNYAGSLVVESVIGAGKRRDNDQVAKWYESIKFYHYMGFSFNLAVNFRTGERFFEITFNRERLKEIQSYLVEASLSWKLQGSLFSEEPGTERAPKEGIYHGIGLVGLENGTNYLSVSISPPVFGGIGLPTEVFDWTYMYDTFWRKVSILRLQLRPPSKLRSCGDVLLPSDILP
jgi:hypothetical protein